MSNEFDTLVDAASAYLSCDSQAALDDIRRSGPEDAAVCTARNVAMDDDERWVGIEEEHLLAAYLKIMDASDAE